MAEIYSNSVSAAGSAGSGNPFEVLKDMFAPTWKDDKCEIVSVVAYLIGVPEEKISGYPMAEKFPALSKNKSARIVRNLSIVRTAIERNFKAINNQMRQEYKDITNIAEIPREAVEQLRLDGVSFVKKSSTTLAQHIVEINRLMTDRINNCKDLFPTWAKWSYIRDLFIMPNGLTEEGTKAAADEYYANKFFYPYQMYINWAPYYAGNILLNDTKFMSILYEQHNDYFTDTTKTADVSKHVKSNIYSFLEQSEKVVVFVDCENCDPYNLCAALRSLDEAELAKISGIILFDDVHTPAIWQIFKDYTPVPVEYMLIERIHAGKSLVDGKLIARACKEHYLNNVDSMILASSDSDYWSLISSLDTAKFLVMVEHDKCGPDLMNALAERDIFYCFLDDFYAGGSEELKTKAVVSEVIQRLQPLKINLKTVLDEALRASRVSMADAEKNGFYEKYLRRLTISADAEGNVSFSLNVK